MSNVRLYCYKLTSDTGFAPNPFCGVLTLATCKPGMRRTKRPGDWIAGFTSAKLCGDPVGEEKLVYLMRVGSTVPLAEYFREPAFARKIPSLNGSAAERAGDNIYRPLHDPAVTTSDFVQVANQHHSEDSAQRDIGGRNALIADQYAYFGRNALHIPADLRPTVPRGQSAQGSLTHDAGRAQAFIDFVFSKAGGRRILGAPHEWPDGDDSWRQEP